MAILEEGEVCNVEAARTGYQPPSTVPSTSDACDVDKTAQGHRIGAVATAARGSTSNGAARQTSYPEKVLGPGLYHDDDVCTTQDVCNPRDEEHIQSVSPDHRVHKLKQDGSSEKAGIPETRDQEEAAEAEKENLDTANKSQQDENSKLEANNSAPSQAVIFAHEETTFVLDWDDSILPSTWIQSQGLRLDGGSEVSSWQREQLTEVAKLAAETVRIAKQYGTVVLITNAERGWVELSCQKFLPTLSPLIEDVMTVSARTSYESPQCATPLEWKLRAFETELLRIYGAETLHDPMTRKNLLSLGDGMHEREALLRLTKDLPSCRSKSLKFVERPDITQICKQHSLFISCYERIIHHDGNLDLCIRCT